MEYFFQQDEGNLDPDATLSWIHRSNDVHGNLVAY